MIYNTHDLQFVYKLCKFTSSFMMNEEIIVHQTKSVNCFCLDT